jgi:predicted PhzF superfamily epimerase YddE/YHI9
MMVDGTEDSATGSAASALAGYLSLKKGKAGGRYRYEMAQGVEMGRVSIPFV